MSKDTNHRKPFVLGASNVVRGCGTLVSHLCSTIGPCQIHLAGGRGRSYGREIIHGNGVHRSYRFHDVAGSKSTKRYPINCVFDDIGNDIAYGSPDELLAVGDYQIAACRRTVITLRFRDYRPEVLHDWGDFVFGCLRPSVSRHATSI